MSRNPDSAKTFYYLNLMKRREYERTKRFALVQTDCIENSIKGSEWDNFPWIVVDRTTKVRVFGSKNYKDCKDKEHQLNGVN